VVLVGHGPAPADRLRDDGGDGADPRSAQPMRCCWLVDSMIGQEAAETHTRRLPRPGGAHRARCLTKLSTATPVAVRPFDSAR